ncbi:MAG: hypothetical protein ACK55I_13305, partial [bacterium]
MGRECPRAARAGRRPLSSVGAPRAADGVHAKLHRIARLIGGRHESAAAVARHAARSGIGPAKLVVDRHHSRARHAPAVLGLELRGRR